MLTKEFRLEQFLKRLMKLIFFWQTINTNSIEIQTVTDFFYPGIVENEEPMKMGKIDNLNLKVAYWGPQFEATLRLRKMLETNSNSLNISKFLTSINILKFFYLI